MTETVDTKRAETLVVQLVNPFELPGVIDTAERIFDQAIDFCTQKMGANSRAAVIALLGQQDRTACEYCAYGVAKQVAAALGAADENIRAVYTLDYDATPEDRCFGEGPPSTPFVHLLVWTQRKTAALDSLVAALDRALVQAHSDTIGSRGQSTLLDVQIVDDADVERRQGYGAFRAWMHQQPIEIWKRCIE